MTLTHLMIMATTFTVSAIATIILGVLSLRIDKHWIDRGLGVLSWITVIAGTILLGQIIIVLL